MRRQDPLKPAFAMMLLLMLITGAWDRVRAADDEAIQRLERIVQAQKEQIEAQARLLNSLQARMAELTRRISGREEIPEEVEKAVQMTDERTGAMTERAETALFSVAPVDPSREEDRMVDQEFMHFKAPRTKTVLTVSGFAKGSVLHDFDAIRSPTSFITSQIVVDGDPPGVADSRTELTANASRFVIGSATPTRIGRLSSFVSNGIS